MNLKMQVDASRCTGCGNCLQACPTGAIRLVDGVATIDASLCRECQACLEACPNGAILAVEEVTEPVPALAPSRTPAPSRPAAGVLPMLGATLAFMGQEVVPKVIDMLLEQRRRQQMQPFPTATSSPLLSQGRRWRWRRRGRR
jgi:Fe-S-cluster-containing hydrogenase component 2